MPERLTEDYYDDMQKITRHSAKSDNIDLNTGGNDFQNIIDKLAEYETAEEEGRLVITPYKIGKVLFLPRRGEVFPFKVVGTRIYENRTEIDLIYCGSKDCYKFLSTHPFIEYVEHEYFKTREEAEKALKEMKKNERILY